MIMYVFYFHEHVLLMFDWDAAKALKIFKNPEAKLLDVVNDPIAMSYFNPSFNEATNL